MRDDLISRQAAIDALAEYIHNVDKVIGTGHLTADDCKDAATSVFEELPSAQQDCSDCIKHGGDWDCDHVHCHKGESAQPEQRWIPCSERMPEDLEEVNVTWVNHDPEPYYNFVKDKPFTGSAVYYKEKWYWYSSKCADILCEYGENDIDEVDDAIEIIAWMPLPKAWKGEEDETDS